MSSSLTRIGRYEVIRELGRGAMGTVFLARDSSLGRLVALKTFRAGSDEAVDLEDSTIRRRRMLREAQRAGTLSHPNIITIFDVVELEDEEGSFFIVMEYVEGQGLDARLREDAPLQPEQTTAIVDQIASALDHLHSRGIIHRDIKPANVLVTREGRVKLTDFGIARTTDPSQTVETEIYGTPQYMAPEQVRGQAIDVRTDVFALGVLLYEMLTGTRPFRGATVAEVTHNILYGRVRPPEVAGAPLSEPLQRVLDRALASDPEARYQSAGALAAAFRAVVEQGSTMAAALTQAMPREQWLAATGPPPATTRRGSLRAIALLASGLLLAAVVALLYLQLRHGGDGDVDADLKARELSYTKLLNEGRHLLASGDAEAAAVLFQTAEGLALDPATAQQLRGEAERQAAEQGAELRLADARADLAAGRYDQALATARKMLALGEGRETALEVLAEVETALSRAEASRRRTPPRRPGPQTTPPSPVASAAPSEPSNALAAQPTPEHRSTLVVDLRSEVAEGVLTVWARERTLVREPFAFYRRQGLVRRAALPGQWSTELVLSPGTLPLRVLVARRGEAAEVQQLEADLPPGGRTVLAISLPADGSPLVELRDGG